MTVPTTTSRADYTGNGVTTAWTVPFYFLDPTHIQVIRTQISTGVATTLALTTDYTVAGAGVQAGGTVTTVAALTTDQRLSVLRNVPLTQLAHYVPNDPFPAATHEMIVDQLTMEVQQLYENIGRALTLSANSSGVSASLPGPTPNNLIGWNSTATALVDVPIASLATTIVANTWQVDKFNGTGSQTAFTLALNPGSTNAVICSVGGVSQTPGVNFSISGNVATFLTGAPPAGTGNVVFQYGQAVTTAAMDASTVSYTPAGAGALNTNVQSKLRESVSVRDFGAKGDGTTDDTAAINAANTYVASLAHGGTVFFPDGLYRTTANISIPAGVSWQGESPGWYYGSSPVTYTGVLIYKQHTQDAVTITSSGQTTDGQVIDSIGILGRGAVDVGGSGFVLGKVATCVLHRCNVFHVYLHSFVIGDGTANSYTNTLEDCYSNNPQTGMNYSINSTLFRGHKLISDGGTIGISFTANATNWSIGECHFEGWSNVGMSIAGGQGKTYGKTYLPSTNILGLVGIYVSGSASGIAIVGAQVAFTNVRTAGSIGMQCVGTTSAITLRDSTIASAEVGVSDVSGASWAATILDGNIFNNCSVGITATTNGCRYLNNYFVGSTTYDINHNGGSGGLWSGNKFSLTGSSAIKPTFSGVEGLYGGNCVKNNSGFVTRNQGWISSQASGATIAHGLSYTTASPNISTIFPSISFIGGAGIGVTSPVSFNGLTGTTITANWSGTTPQQIYWQANMACDF
ncbi:Pectate lyase superfamily protein [uncultured Caudovirales phage]|uniref:Pectate lyase superfamily protein n=1 Tax=uncultured Caudovirales phage TaxID=2100421 RepID=A0A6J7W986_9CAUD|nr:Pectate lyase superfamily protein [uncultured Caudovirales phage]